MDIPVLMTVSDSWTSSCLSATQDSVRRMMDYKQSKQKHYIVLSEIMARGVLTSAWENRIASVQPKPGIPTSSLPYSSTETI